jgi:hypothetical protein
LIVAELTEIFVRWGVSEFLLDFDKPSEGFLSSKAMEWASESVETCRVGQIRIRQSGTDQMGSVSRHVTSLVVGMDGEITSHALGEGLGVSKSEHVRQIGTIVQTWVRSNEIVIEIRVTIDVTSSWSNLSNKIH